MNRLLLLFAISLTFLGSACAPIKPFVPHSNLKKWEDGKLTWKDFKKEPLPIYWNGYDFRYFFLYQPQEVLTRDTTFLKLKAFAYFAPDESWVFDTAKTDLNLKRLQFHFDNLELHRRSLENRLVAPKNLQEIEAIYAEERRLMMEDDSRIFLHTRSAQDTALIHALEARQKRQLDSIKTNIPKISEENFGGGMYIGLGKAMVKDKLGEQFSGFFGLALGTELDLYDFRFFLNVGVGTGETLKPIKDPFDWPVGLKVNMSQVGFALGYPIFDKSRFRITPFVGPAFINVSPIGREPDQYKDQYYADKMIAWGLQVDLKFRNRVNLYNNPGITDYGLKTQFIYYPIDFSNSLNGSAYNLSFSYYFNSRKIKVHKRN